MGFSRFLIKRIINMVIVLFFTLLITIILVGPTMDNILKLSIEQECRGEANNLKFPTADDRNDWIENCITTKIHTVGLDEPWYSPKRLGFALLKIMSLDFGRAYFLISDTGSGDVADIILERLPRTVLLFTTSTVIISIIGLYLGAFSASKVGSVIDKLVSTFAVISSSFPLWWTGMLMILVFAFVYSVFPASATPLVSASDPSYIPQLLYHMALPLITIVLVGFGGWAYIVRNFVVGILNEDYIMVKRAEGIPEKKVIYSHALKNAAPPIITVLALSLSGSIGGAIISEAVFNWPGMGKLYFDAISVLDIPVIIGLTYITTLLFLVSIFIADLLYGFFDPRVRIG
ncbi:MAG TPA: ABC transporter permease [Nitrososphaerales archaeon]|nr:ABC transporter permease [Nitrososphaerales archaeon]